MSQTVDQITGAALRLLTVKQSGEALTADESTDGRQALNELIEQMNTQSLFQVAKKQITQTITPNQGSYTFGVSGDPELIFDGGSGGDEWTGSIIVGTWNFSDLGKVTITNASNFDDAKFKGSTPVDMSTYTDMIGKVTLTTYDGDLNAIYVQYAYNDALVGNAVNLNSYIDADVDIEQDFTVPKSIFGVGDSIINQIYLTITVASGTPPTIGFDDFKILQTGDNSVRPLEIFTAYVVDSNVTYPVKILMNEEYSLISFKTTTSSYPYNIYFRKEYPLSTIEMYPVPTTEAALYLETRAALSTYTAGSDIVDLPPGYIKYLKYQLAVEIGPEYKDASPSVRETARKSEALIKRQNAKDKPIMANVARMVTRTKGYYIT